jgi:signal transduction histidine kinase/CheY-like chemotaxis protein
MDSSEDNDKNVFIFDSKELAEHLTTVQKMYLSGDSRESIFEYFLSGMMTLLSCDCGFIAELLTYEDKKVFSTIAVKNLLNNKICNKDSDEDHLFYQMSYDEPLFKEIQSHCNKPHIVKNNDWYMKYFGWNLQCRCSYVVPFYEKDEITGVIVLAPQCKCDLSRAYENEKDTSINFDCIMPIKYICASLLKGFRTQSLKDIYENIVNYVSLPILVFTKDPVKLWVTKEDSENNNKKAIKFYSAMQLNQHDMAFFNCIVCNESFHQLKTSKKLLSEEGEPNNDIEHGNTTYNVLEQGGTSNIKLMGKSFYDCFPNMIDNKQLQHVWLDMWKTGNKTSIDAIRYYDKYVKEDLYSIEFNKLDQRTFMMTICPVSDQLKSNELVENMAKTQEEFVGKISHELRTPVNAILSIVSLLYDSPFAKQQGEAAHDFRQKLQMMSESSVTLCSLIQDIIDYTQLESKKLNVSYQMFDLVECIDNALSMISTDARRKGLNLIKSIENDVPLCVISDPKRLKQILVNLLSNAVKFTYEGQININVSIKKPRLPNNICNIQFAVNDTGSGISKSSISKLFKPFSQVRPEHNGTGLGLVISKHLTNLLGGDIWVESEENVGSTFYFTIKAKACGIDSIKEYYGPILKHSKLLVIDDNHESRNKIITYLIDQNIQVISADNANLAQTYLQSKSYNFDYVIADIKYEQMIKKYHDSVILIMDEKDSSLALHSDNSYIFRPIDKILLLQILYSLSASSGKKKLIYNFAAEEKLSHNPSLKILIVEDDYINSQVLKEILTKLGYSNISETENGLDALDVIKKDEFDVVLLDLKMPIMNGYQFFENMKVLYKESQIKKIPYTIALTASAMNSDKQRCFAMGMNQYLGKPINVNELKEVLNNLD